MLFLQLWAVKYGVVMIVLIISQEMNGFRERSVLELTCLTLVSFFFCFFPGSISEWCSPALPEA